MNRKTLVNHLKEIGLENAIADTRASSEGNPAVLLRWNGHEEYYTGTDIPDAEYPVETPEQLRYRNWLLKTFK
jgi:hypothetical protein